MKKENTLFELLMGIIFSSVVIQVIVAVISKNYLYNAIGLWSGTVIACFMAIHMKRSIEDSLDLNPEDGVKHMRKSYGTRMAVVAVAVIGILISKLGNPITLVIGILPLKFSAYAQPLIHNVLSRLENRRKN
jgi:membrane protein YqaA with SNARE-associated domain